MKSLYLSSKKSQMNVSLLGIYERLEAVLNFSKKFFLSDSPLSSSSQKRKCLKNSSQIIAR